MLLDVLLLLLPLPSFAALKTTPAGVQRNRQGCRALYPVPAGTVDSWSIARGNKPAAMQQQLQGNCMLVTWSGQSGVSRAVCAYSGAL